MNVDEELKQRMEAHAEINWSHIARTAFEAKVSDFELLERLESESELTEADVEKLAEVIDENVAERLVER